ncbi:hypothetical protein DZF97_03965, partial [Clavibacter nebraskensis]
NSLQDGGRYTWSVRASDGYDEPPVTWTDELYPEVVPGATVPAASADPVDAVLVPYALWGNRSPAAMRVWIRAADTG